MTGITNSACPVFLTLFEAQRLWQIMHTRELYTGETPHPVDVAIHDAAVAAIRKFEERDAA